ncbi:MAG TPA: ferritin-like domain-containing protein [Blastocatellia bacterium]|nr:ferritin-like domain-containing protein [Blastocatellia bacterium]
MGTTTYTLPLDESTWDVEAAGITTIFNWQYQDGREKLLNLYEKGKTKQWNANQRIDWSIEIDKTNPLGFPDYYVSIYGSDIWNKMNDVEKAQVRLHFDGWRFSQFMHGEQGALICAAKIVQTVPDIDSKFYAATQVFDEARHVEVFSRYLNEKIELAYPINPHLKTLLDQAITDRRWDLTYLAMQVIIEGLALAAFSVIRDLATEPLGRALNAYVMEDEARHVAFGRLALRDYYPKLSEQERDEREQFAVEACYLMRDRFLAEEVWDNLGVGAEACVEYVRNSPMMQAYQKRLFSRIVPTIKDIGLWGKRIQDAFVDMGVMEFAELDSEELSKQDENVAAEFDKLRTQRANYVNSVIAEGTN